MAALLLLLAGLSSAAGYQLIARIASRRAPFPRPVAADLVRHPARRWSTSSASFCSSRASAARRSRHVTILIAAIVLVSGYVSSSWLSGSARHSARWRDFRIPHPTSWGRCAADIGRRSRARMLGVRSWTGSWGTVSSLLLGTQPPTSCRRWPASIDIVLVCSLARASSSRSARNCSSAATPFRHGWATWARDRRCCARRLLRPRPHHQHPHFAVHARGRRWPETGDLEVLVIAPVGLALGWLFIRRGLLASIASTPGSIPWRVVAAPGHFAVVHRAAGAACATCAARAQLSTNWARSRD